MHSTIPRNFSRMHSIKIRFMRAPNFFSDITQSASEFPQNKIILPLFWRIMGHSTLQTNFIWKRFRNNGIPICIIKNFLGIQEVLRHGSLDPFLSGVNSTTCWAKFAQLIRVYTNRRCQPPSILWCTNPLRQY